jgi:hypothetical protein
MLPSHFATYPADQAAKPYQFPTPKNPAEGGAPWSNFDAESELAHKPHRVFVNHLPDQIQRYGVVQSRTPHIDF